jgi:LPLT family lysophospholipid transporter-like MFS transporter
LANVNRALIGGILLGPAILAIAFMHDLSLAYVWMIVIGICGGSFVVPLNALLQARGHETIGAGNALAVQNFAENIAMLLFVGGYSWAAAAGVQVVTSVIGFSAVLTLVIGVLAVFRSTRQ